MSSSVPVGALIGWMLLLTFKHVIADFVLQTSWMAIGKDQKTGWALPLLAHCLVHLAVAMVLILIVAPRFWFVALIDFAIHITVDRAKGLLRRDFRRDAGEQASVVLDADRGRPGAAPSHRFWLCRYSWRRILILAGAGRHPAVICAQRCRAACSTATPIDREIQMTEQPLTKKTVDVLDSRMAYHERGEGGPVLAAARQSDLVLSLARRHSRT